MTGPEHYRAAESLLSLAETGEAGSPVERYYLGAAQVHATLALAASSALATKPSSAAQMREWAAAIGDPYEEGQ